jgi:homoserine kinase type II
MTNIVDQALTAWSLTPPWTIEPISIGTNNQSAAVACADGRFMLHISETPHSADQVLGVHTLLTQLAGMNLSFQVPVPIPARDGSTVVDVPGEGGGLASLCRFIPGSHPDPGDISMTMRCGAALAELHEALAQLMPAPTIETPDQLGRVDGVHPLVPEPRQLLANLPNDAAIRARSMAILDRLEGTVEFLVESGPPQLIHGDLYPSNVLVQDGTVSGILDFEFVLTGPPIVDVAIGLHAFAISRRTERDPMPVMRAFIEGYRQHRQLAGGDLRLLSTCVLLREMRSLIYRGGRWRQGLTTEEDVARRAIALVNLADWVNAQSPDLGLH